MLVNTSQTTKQEKQTETMTVKIKTSEGNERIEARKKHKNVMLDTFQTKKQTKQA